MEKFIHPKHCLKWLVGRNAYPTPPPGTAPEHTFELQRNIAAVASRWRLLPCPHVQFKQLRKPTGFLRHN